MTNLTLKDTQPGTEAEGRSAPTTPPVKTGEG